MTRGVGRVAKLRGQPCWRPQTGTTVWFMNELPAAYTEYLQGRDESFIATVLPVLKQSVAEKTHGVHITLNSHELQARTDPTVPFGQIVEAASD